ncbi:MAG: hypothetical protein ACR2PW_00515, partial [Gammaproteobacteria bacterium]
MKKILLSTALLASGLIVGCGQQSENAYGDVGWADSDDLKSVSTTNPRGDQFHVSVLELFGKSAFLFSFVLESSDLLGVCAAGESSEEEGLTT